MKITGICLILLLGVFTNGFAFDPPNGLQWDMNHVTSKKVLNSLKKDRRLKVGKLKKGKDLPQGFLQAELKKVKLLKKKAAEARLIFTSDTSLCAVQYGFSWGNKEKKTNLFETANKGRDQAWSYYGDISRAMINKYGEPTEDGVPPERLGSDIASETRLERAWIDPETGDKIILVITRKKVNAIIARIDKYIVALVYHDKRYTRAKFDQAVDPDEI